MKICSKCEVEKELSEFNRDKKRLDGAYYICKQCERSKRQTADYKIYDRNRRINWLNKSGNKQKERDRNNTWRRNNLEKVKKSRIKSRYGLSKEEYDLMLQLQNNSCAICLDNFDNVKCCVDHCHSTGKVRGLLCPKCNQSLGLLKEDIRIINSMIGYLQNKDTLA